MAEQKGVGSQDHPTLGAVIRNLRAQRGWTLREMSESTDIPVSTLSKVEHDRLTLTYDKLLQLSQKLNIRIADLFTEASPVADPGVTGRRSIGRLADAMRVERLRTTTIITSARSFGRSGWCLF